MTRADVVAELASRTGREQCLYPIQVATDGVDAALFVRAEFEVRVVRAEGRDHRQFGSAAQVRRRYAERYVPGQGLYLAEAQPEQHVSVVVDNTDAAHPSLGGF